LVTFAAEHREHLGRLRTIVEVAATGNALSTGEMEEAFRRAHSLKGAARVVELRPLEALAHRLEALFARVRERKLDVNAAVVSAVRRALDASEDWMAASASGREPPNLAAALHPLGELPGESEAALSSTATPQASVVSPSTAAAGGETVRLSASTLDRLLGTTGGLTATALRQQELVERLAELERLSAVLARRRQPTAAHLGGGLTEPDDTLRTLAGGLRRLRRQQERAAWELAAVASQLREELQQARLVNAESVLEGFGTMVRELARAQGKEVEVELGGLDVEADREVLQALKDPLMHLLRNAITHGVEPPAERLSAGKPAAGRVALQLTVDGDRLRALVEDDGRGIDLAAVRRQAVAQGLIDAAGEAGIEALRRLLLRPGFTTVAEASELAGRGIGLAVVEEATARLGGELEIAEGSSGGTRFTLAVPVSLTSRRLLLVAAGGQTWALPMGGVERLARPLRGALASAEGRSVLTLGEQAVPVASLAALLGLPDPTVRPGGGRLPIVVLRSGGRRVAVAVDALVDELEGVVRDLPLPRRWSPKLAGGLLLADGSLCLVLDVRALVEAHAAGPLAVDTPAPPPRPPTVLVVDDSLTTRVLERSVLEAYGYRVRAAVDGVEALLVLRSEPVDLVVADLQMPRLDGFGLLGEMKRDERLSEIPVVLLTSMDSPAERQRGLALGAEAYLVKRDFDQRELLETLRQVL
jgi:two-component system chemotaxis sensor kinase CheA